MSLSCELIRLVVEFTLERVTNIAMGTEIDNIVEFEDALDQPLDDTPTGPDVTPGGKLLPV
jgi:tartronate-semialdehyde synthase